MTEKKFVLGRHDGKKIVLGRHDGKKICTRKT